MTNMTHSLVTPFDYLDPMDWNCNSFHVKCTCGWIDPHLSRTCDRQGKLVDHFLRSENIIKNHEMLVNLLTSLQLAHVQYHSNDKATKAHVPMAPVAHNFTRPSYFSITCACGITVEAKAKVKSPFEVNATVVRRQFYSHCYTSN